MGARKGRLKSRLISLEGPDGCGKSTQLALLARALRAKGISVTVTREPGGTRFGRTIRSLLLDARNTDLAERAELFLYLADRAQHVQEVIVPALRRGDIVLVDRYLDSTWVYQGAGRKFPLSFIEECNAFAVDEILPDLTLVFDLDVRCGLARRGHANKDRMESQSLAFHQRVRAGFQRLKKRFGDRVVVLDGSKTPEEVHRKVLGLVHERFGL